MAEQIARKI